MNSAASTFAWTVPVDHPAFPGHFPGLPIVPGVVLLDRAILFAGKGLARSTAACRIATAKFFSPVGPGETLVFSFAAKAGGNLSCDIRCDGRAVAALTLSFPEQGTP